jgi:hypothetical protein
MPLNDRDAPSLGGEIAGDDLPGRARTNDNHIESFDAHIVSLSQDGTAPPGLPAAVCARVAVDTRRLRQGCQMRGEPRTVVWRDVWTVGGRLLARRHEAQR